MGCTYCTHKSIVRDNTKDKWIEQGGEALSMSYLVCVQCEQAMCASCVGFFQQVLWDRVVQKTGGTTFQLYDCLKKVVDDAPPQGTVLAMDGCNTCKFSEVDLLTTEFPDANLDMTSTYATGGAAEMDGEKQKDYESDRNSDVHASGTRTSESWIAMHQYIRSSQNQRYSSSSECYRFAKAPQTGVRGSVNERNPESDSPFLIEPSAGKKPRRRQKKK